PRIYYRNLWRYSTCFIGGSVSAEANGVVDCVEGATVRLIRNGQPVAELQSDNYGDFKFDKLAEDSGAYVVEIEAAGHKKKTVETRLGVSANLGEIRL
ncbi:MAG: oxidoreductase, partial [Rhizobiales bacterium]|nr:oxidoreductase [Hyphomicrobiales bacterium]